MMALKRWLVWSVSFAALALLAACAVPGWEKPGAQRADVLARLGAPTARYALPNGGERLQYSEMPAGVAVHNLDFDAQGRLYSVSQPLTPASLEQIRVDVWTANDVRLLLGNPMLVEHVAMFTGDIWTYRFLDMNSPRLVHVHIDPMGVVRRILYTDEVSGRDNQRDD
ncbi:MAG TPA: hypothetical protein VGC24_07230 [Burkholderiaceae bacterium]